MAEKPIMVYDKIQVGEELPPFEIELTDELQGRYLLAVDDDNPWYWKDSPFGGAIAHHSAFDGSPMALVDQKYEYPFGWVHAVQETEFYNPVRLTKKVRITGKIADKYVKRGKEYIVVEALVTDEDGVEIMRSRNHGMIGDERIREAAKYGLHHRQDRREELGKE